MTKDIKKRRGKAHTIRKTVRMCREKRMEQALASANRSNCADCAVGGGSHEREVAGAEWPGHGGRQFNWRPDELHTWANELRTLAAAGG